MKLFKTTSFVLSMVTALLLMFVVFCQYSNTIAWNRTRAWHRDLQSIDQVKLNLKEMLYCVTSSDESNYPWCKQRIQDISRSQMGTLAHLSNGGTGGGKEPEIGQYGKSLRYITAELLDLATGVVSHRSTIRPSEMQRLLSLQVQPEIDQLTKDLTDRQSHLASITDTTMQEISARNEIELTLSVVAMLVSLSAAAAAVYSRHQLRRRLTAISDNFSRYGAGQNLESIAFNGLRDDDVSVVDARFHQMVHKLAESSEKEAVAIDNLPIALITFRSSGAIVNSNPKARQLLGTDQLLDGNGHLSRIFVDHTDYSKLEAAITGHNFDILMRCRLHGSEGHTFPAEVTLSKFQYLNKIRYHLAILDVSVREEMDRLRQEFVSVVSHDIRTPLTSIRECLSTVAREQADILTASVANLLVLARQESDRLVSLTSDLLDIAKLEAGGLHLELETWDAQYLMERAAEATKLQAREKQISVTIEETLVEVSCDKDRIIQVLVNFLTNAIKYSPECSVVKMKAHEADNYLYFHVVDEGRGIPESMVTEIFERFRQTRTTDAKAGTGLGLSICRLLAECHGGAVGVKSKEDEGSDFWLCLPALRAFSK